MNGVSHSHCQGQQASPQKKSERTNLLVRNFVFGANKISYKSAEKINESKYIKNFYFFKRHIVKRQNCGTEA